MDGQCAICDAPLDLIELMSFSLDEIGEPRFCESCKADEDLVEEYRDEVRFG